MVQATCKLEAAAAVEEQYQQLPLKETHPNVISNVNTMFQPPTENMEVYEHAQLLIVEVTWPPPLLCRTRSPACNKLAYMCL